MENIKVLLLYSSFILTTFFVNTKSFGQTVPTPTQTDEIIIDLGAPGSADPNDRIRYKVTIQNTGGPEGTGTQLNIVPDPRTTFVAGSFRSSPLALPDTYACTGNVGLSVPVASGLLSNDFDDNPAGLTVTAVTNAATTQGGSITIIANGSFSYTPPAGFTGNDTYVYTLNDGNPVTGVTATDMGTITFTVSNMLWFVDNTGGGAGGAGTLSNPFKTLGDFNASAGPLAGHLVFIRHTGTDYGGGIVLKNTMTLFGSGHTGGANLANVLPFSLATNSVALPAINGTRPVITNTSGDGVTLSSGNSLRGFDVGACSDFGIENTGTSSVGNLVVSEVSINNTTGGGFDASHGSGSGMNAVFTAISSTGGINGINLTNCEGTFTVNGGTITNPTGTGVLISGGSVTISCAAAVTDNTGFAVDVDNHDSNNVTFSGNITSTGTGIRVQNCNGGTKTFSGSSKNLNTGANTAVTLSSNTGATINFTGGGLVITTTTGTGFNATGGGTVTVQGTDNTINSTTGTALNVTNTIIGASGLTFQSISKNGGTNGIVLNTTGSAGGLTVTGTGIAGSGGTIQNCTGAGISLTSTSNTNLSRMIIQGGGDDGIYGSLVNGISLSNCTINNNGNDTGDEGIEFLNLLGTSTISNCSVTNNAKNNFKLYNTSGTLTSLTVSGSTFEGHNNPTGNHGFLFEASGTALVSAVNITNSIFRNNFSLGMQVIGGGAATISSYIVSGCTFSDTGTGNSQEVAADFAISGTSEMTYQFLDNTLTGHNSHAFNTFTGAGAGTTGKMYGLIQGNTIGVQATIDSGSKIGNGIRININGDSDARIRIHNNTIHQIPTGRGIECIVRNGNGNASFTVTNNTITAPTGTTGIGCGGPGVLCPLAPIHVQSNCVSVCNTGCAVVSGNTAYDPTTVPGGFESSVQLQESSTSTLTYEGNTALTALQNLINANPNCVTKSVSGAVAVVVAGTCPTQ